jgi:SAM-dependent methyltransferase
MLRINDQEYLRNQQYKDASNLNARIRLHVEFSTNPYGWFRWVFDQFEKLAYARVLEVGCGPGDLWLENLDRIPNDWEVTLTDFSGGMLDQAHVKLGKLIHPFRFETLDVQSIPHQADYFDIVIANHFLYHVPDRHKAISEIRRVLKPEGRFYATTIGVDHMKELPGLLARFEPEESIYLSNKDIPFTMENGTEQLRPFFVEVKMRRYPDELRVTSVNALVDYAFSGMRLGLDDNRRNEFTQYIEGEMAAQGGVISIKKDSGIFLAR